MLCSFLVFEDLVKVLIYLLWRFIKALFQGLRRTTSNSGSLN